MNSVYLQSTFYFDTDSEEIQNLVKEFINLDSNKEKIEKLYLEVRDNWRYNPYVIGLTNKHYRASFIANKKEAHCIDKAILYVAGLRALDIPARLRLAKVSNHIAVEKLVNKLGSNHVAPHGLAEVFYDNKWVKCSPAFNKELCEMYNVAPLDFDGTQDSIFQEYNKNNAKFMSYSEDYGSFDDVPLNFIKNTFRKNYPKFYEQFKNVDEVNL